MQTALKLTSLVARLLRSRKELRYVISGLASEAIEYGSFVLLIALTDLLVVSNSISFFLGIGSGFVFHKLWSFAGAHQFKTHQQIVGYGIIATFNFVTTNVLISFLVHDLHVQPLIAKLLTMTLTAIWSFVIFNVVLFKNKKISE